MTIEAGLAAAAEGMGRVESGANPEWMAAMSAAVEEIARKQRFFNADDVFRVAPAGIETRDNRAFGPVMARAKGNGICKSTQTFVKSEREELHATDIRVWESLIYDDTGRESQSQDQQTLA